jgi:hypothetical protein
VGFFGQRFSRASASERRRRSRSAALSFFGTPLARRPRAEAMRDASSIAALHATAPFPRLATVDERIPTRFVAVGAALGFPIQQLAFKRLTAGFRPVLGSDLDWGRLPEKRAPGNRIVQIKLSHSVLPFCGVPHLHENTVTDNRFPVNRENATIFQGCLPNIPAHLTPGGKVPSVVGTLNGGAA